MKKFRLALVCLSLLFALTCTNLSAVHVHADGGDPQGQQDTSSRGAAPAASGAAAFWAWVARMLGW